MTGIVALISSFFGLFGGSLPKVFELFEKKMSFAQELKIRQMEYDSRAQEHRLQLELAERNISGKIDEAQLDIIKQEVISNMQGMMAVIAESAKPSGIWWIDTLNAAIRPVFFTAVLILFLITCAAYVFAEPALFAKEMVALYAFAIEGTLGVVVGQRLAAKIPVLGFGK